MLLVVGALVLLASLAWDVLNGPAGLGWRELSLVLTTSEQLDVGLRVILWDIRLPFALMALLAGAALGLAGAEFQTALDNPLASPMTLGVSAAATLGAALVLVFDPLLPDAIEQYAVSTGAFVAAMTCALLVQALGRFFGGGAGAMVLLGITFSFALEALVSLVQFVAEAGALQQVVFWRMGSLARADWHKLALLSGVLVLCLLWALRQAWVLTALCAGEEQARALGIDVGRLRLHTLLRASLLAGVAVSLVGTIGFVGLVAPHLARLVLGQEQRHFLPGAALAGALVLSLASIASKSIIPGLIVPVGIVTAMVGVPLFIGLILLQRRAL
ncbi:iron ABC transporter permease [Uliginosibacterium sp. IMCC34675]|uniref:Iron ABC transporter permease n=2 Tax=Uliginosibacterium aquaticum TaxID=2731212 RepID=A0ABX2IKG4_9RHOO|nr:iron ABC transporter permease [Uliginosibacterium aquaticum]